MDFKIIVEPATEPMKRCCCNCRRNIRAGQLGFVKCHCEIDGHYIGYVECFEHWCRRWAKAKEGE